MANTKIPTNLRLVSFYGPSFIVGWSFPYVSILTGYTFRVYSTTDLSTPYTMYTETSGLMSSISNSYYPQSLYVAVSSVYSGEESSLSDAFFVSKNNIVQITNTVTAIDDSGAVVNVLATDHGRLQVKQFDINQNTLSPGAGTLLPASQGGIIVQGSDGVYSRILKTDSSGILQVSAVVTGSSNTNIHTSVGGSLTATANALDINVKTSSINVPISIAAQTLTAVQVSATSAANLVSNPIFTRLTDGAAALGVTGNPLFVNIKDGSGTALTSTGSALDVNIKSDGVTAIPVSATASLNTVSNPLFVELTTGSAALTNTSNALDINVKTSSINVPISIAAQTLTAVQVSPTTAANTLANPFFNKLTDGTNPIGTISNPLFIGHTNRDNSRVETIFGASKVAQEDTLLARTFAEQLSWDDIDRYIEGPGTISYINGKLRLTSGTSIGKVRIKGQPLSSYVAGVGFKTIVSIIKGDTGASGCVRRFGAMDAVGVNGFFFELSGTTLQIVRRSAGVNTNITAASWNIVNSITVDTNGHIWEVSYQWLGVGRILFKRDGIEVHSIEYAGTSSELSIQTPNLMPWIEIENTSTQGASRTVDIGSMAMIYESSSARNRAVRRYIASTNTIPSSVSSGTEHGVLAINFRSLKGSLVNNSIAIVKKLVVSVYGSASVDVDIRIKKNVIFGGSAVSRADNTPAAPQTEWGATVVTATVSGTSATGTGYGTSVNLTYRITGLGAVGETVVSTSSATVSSGSPAKQINLSWPAITYATAYNIYRQVTAGSFFLIGTSDSLSFVDNAFIASATTPPGASTAEGESFMSILEDLSPGAAGFTSNTGRSLTLIKCVSNQLFSQDFISQELTLAPGENLMISATPGGNGQTITGFIQWEEGVPSE